MALVHPGRPRAVAYDRGVRVSRPMHPAIGLLVGFAILIGVASSVHMLFSLI